MRIGIDATPLPPQPVGAGNYIIHLIRGLNKLDTPCQFVIFCYPHGRDLIGAQQRSNWNWVILPEKNPGGRLTWEQIGLPLAAKRAGVDLLHSLHYTMPFVSPCPTVVTYHDMTFFLYPRLHTPYKRLFFPLAIRASARRADALLAVSESTRQDAIRLLGIPPSKIYTTPLGVADHFKPIRDVSLLHQVREKYHLPEKFILYVGLVEPRKNLLTLLDAYRTLIERGIKHSLVIAGRFGWGYTDFLRKIESWGLQDRVLFTGYISQQELPMVYNLAVAFVYPSIYEGFGLPPLEAMACGVPVITTAVSSLPEIVGDAGILVPPEDGDALSQAILEVLQTPGRQAELRARGIQQAAKFTWERTSRETYRVYQRILPGNRAE